MPTHATPIPALVDRHGKFDPGDYLLDPQTSARVMRRNVLIVWGMTRSVERIAEMLDISEAKAIEIVGEARVAEATPIPRERTRQRRPDKGTGKLDDSTSPTP